MAAVRQEFDELWSLFRSGATREHAWRAAQLDGLVRFLDEREADALRALRDDLGRCAFEAALTEVVVTRNDAARARRALRAWMRDEHVPTPALLCPASSFVRREPLGVCLLIGPFNYPLQLLLCPLIGALAAGNCAVLKPSERAPATSALLARALPAYCAGVAVVEGGPDVGAELAARRWGLTFFTGAKATGQRVARAAAATLTPTVLELGGKTPVLVDGTVDPALAARRLAWGKTLGCGQTCVAPDLILVTRAAAEPLLGALGAALRSFYGPSARESADYGRMVDGAAVARLRAALDEPHGGRLYCGGQTDEAARYVAPTIVVDPAPSSQLMRHETLGPVLVVLTVESVEAGLALLEARAAVEEPLCACVFSADAAVHAALLARVRSGAVLVNDCVVHAAHPHLPFGGVGLSGHGAYHGRASYEAFSHARAVLVRPAHAALELDRPLRYPPYSAPQLAAVRAALLRLPCLPPRPLRALLALLLARALWRWLRARYALARRLAPPAAGGRR